MMNPNSPSNLTTTPCLQAPVVARTASHIASRISIGGLPIPNDKSLSNSEIIRIVHGYKHLLTHGVKAGRTESERRKEEQEPLDNDEFQLPVAYTYMVSTDKATKTAEITIDFILSTAATAIIRLKPGEQPPKPAITKPSQTTSKSSKTSSSTSNHLQGSWMYSSKKQRPAKKQREPEIPQGYRKMTIEEIQLHLDNWCDKCAQEIETYLHKVYQQAVINGTEPDYYGSSIK